jgi:hypothetical protein
MFCPPVEIFIGLWEASRQTPKNRDDTTWLRSLGKNRTEHVNVSLALWQPSGTREQTFGTGLSAEIYHRNPTRSISDRNSVDHFILFMSTVAVITARSSKPDKMYEVAGIIIETFNVQSIQ